MDNKLLSPDIEKHLVALEREQLTSVLSSSRSLHSAPILFLPRVLTRLQRPERALNWPFHQDSDSQKQNPRPKANQRTNKESIIG